MVVPFKTLKTMAFGTPGITCRPSEFPRPGGTFLKLMVSGPRPSPGASEDVEDFCCAQKRHGP